MNNQYQLHRTDRLADIPAFGEWLAAVGRREELIGVAVRDRQKKLALTTRDEGWLIDFKTTHGQLAAGVLRVGQSQLRLVTRNLAHDLVELTRFLARYMGIEEGEIYHNIAPTFVGDLTTAANCINQSVTPPGKFRQLEQDAFEAVLLEPQFTHAITPYYAKVGVPFAKLVAEAMLFRNKRELEWWVSYENLWVRVLAYYSGDPTLSWAIHENRDPFAAVGRLLKVSLEQAELILLWQACGRDMQTMVNRFGNRVRDLPDDPQAEWGAIVDRALPTLTSACQAMQRAYWDSRAAETRYGRRLRPGNPIGEGVAFRVFGTVEDIVATAAVTFANNRPTDDTRVVQFDGGPAATIIRIGGVGPGPGGLHTWLETLKTLAPLLNPLGTTSLSPTVVSV